MPVFAKWLRKFTSIFAEKTAVKPDDFGLEHFLLYNGLVGSSPENQRAFKDVRADIKLAVENKSSRELCASLKLPPLWWEEKLKSIFAEIGERETVIAMLAPQVKEDDMTFEGVPLLHQDWRVRANAALLLANLEASEVVDKLEHSLHDTASNAIIAFCHQAYALGRLGQAQSHDAIARYLRHEENWIRVDAAGALAELTKEDPSNALMEALLEKHDLSDYRAVAVSRAIKPPQLCQSSEEAKVLAGSQMVMDIIDASKATFTPDIVIDTETNECLPPLATALEKKNSCLVAQAAMRLADWLDTNHSYTLHSPADPEAIKKVQDFADSQAMSKLIAVSLEKNGKEKACPIKTAELRSAIDLAGETGKIEDPSKLKALLASDHPLLDDTIKALTRLEAQDSANQLIELAKSLVDVNDRAARPKQLHPVLEPDQKASRSYWLILKALAVMPSRTTIEFLLVASEDHAPDKREQALESLVQASSSLKNEIDENLRLPVKKRVSDALSDQSADVRKVALAGVTALSAVEDLKKVVVLTRAREVSVGRAALDTLSELAKKGHKKDVIEHVAQALKTETDVHKRQKLKDFIDTCERQVPANTT